MFDKYHMIKTYEAPCIRITIGNKYNSAAAVQRAAIGQLSEGVAVFGEDGMFGKDVEDKTRQAWKVTMKKLDKLNTPVDKFKDDLARERIDQVFNVHSPLHIIILDLFYGILDTKLLIQNNYYVIKSCRVL